MTTIRSQKWIAVLTVMSLSFCSGAFADQNRKPDPARRVNPPARQVTPPARQVTPPARQVTPPARQVTPPARQVTPPARQVTPPARQVTPPARQVTPPARQVTPPANQNHQTQNQTPPRRTPTPDGGHIENRGNHEVKFRADGSREYMRSGNHVVQYRQDGSKAQETRGGTVTTFHRDGSHSVNVNGRPLYSEARVQHQGTTHIQRTYIQNNVTVVRNYRPYVYGGYSYYSYVPGVYYERDYYGYLYRPWGSAYYHSWGWRYEPWYGCYNYYYRPYPAYYGPSYWLTDYLIADMLASSYQNAVEARAYARAQQAQTDANAAALDATRAAQEARDAAALARSAPENRSVVLTDEIKDQIRAQVEEAIRAHERHESIPLATTLADRNHIFVVSNDLELTLENSETSCSVTNGDLLRLSEAPAAGAQVARMVVVTAKRDSCRAGSHVVISMRDLQEFLNEFGQRVETGMGQMRQQVNQAPR